jgi:hypothetical protein
MPIDVRFLPSAAVIGGAALAGGLGQYAQRQQEMGLRRQAMDQDWAQQQQQLAAHLYSQQQSQLANQQSQLFHAQQNVDQWNAEAATRADEFNARRQAAEQDAERNRQWHTEDLASQQDFQRQQAQDQRQSIWEAKSQDAVENQIGTQMATYAKQRPYMTPEGQRLLGDLTGKLRAVQKQRLNVRPQQYMELLGQFGEEVARSGLDNHINPPKTIEQQVQEGTHREPVNAPDGTFMGYNVWSSVNRNGSTQLVNKFVPHKADDTTAKPATFEQRYQNFDTFNKDYSAVRKELEAAKPPDSEATVSHEAVLDAMKQRFEAYQKANGKWTDDNERQKHQKAWEDLKKELPATGFHD